MRKEHRDVERKLRTMGFTILSRSRGKHHKFRLLTPDGREVLQTIPHSLSSPRFWPNFEQQLRKHLEVPNG